MIMDQGSLKDETQDQKLCLVLSDFDKLFFSPNPCNDAFDKINYNEGKEANPFDKIAKYYGREKDVFFFISMLRNENQSNMMRDIVRQKCDEAPMAKFIERVNIYLQRIKSGEFAAKECLENFDYSSAFFNGPHVGEDRNVYANLNINLTKPGQFLEISSVFNFESQKMLEEKSMLQRIKIYNDGNRMATIVRDGKEKNVSFNKHGSCLFVVSLASESENDLSHAIFIIAINLGKINNVEVRIGGKPADPKAVIHLSKEIHSVFLFGSFFDALEKFLKEEKSYSPTIDSSFLEKVAVKTEQQEYIILT